MVQVYGFSEDGARRVVRATRTVEYTILNEVPRTRRGVNYAPPSQTAMFELQAALHASTTAAARRQYWDGTGWANFSGQASVTDVTLRGDLFTGYAFDGDLVSAQLIAGTWFAIGAGTVMAQGTISGTTVTLVDGVTTVTVQENLGAVDDGSLVWVGWDERQQLWDVVSAECSVPGQLNFSQTYNSGQLSIL